MALNKYHTSIKHPHFTYRLTLTQALIREGELCRAELIFPVILAHSKQIGVIEAIIDILATSEEEAIFDLEVGDENE